MCVGGTNFLEGHARTGRAAVALCAAAYACRVARKSAASGEPQKKTQWSDVCEAQRVWRWHLVSQHGWRSRHARSVARSDAVAHSLQRVIRARVVSVCGERVVSTGYNAVGDT